MKICTISFHSCPYSSLGGNGSGGMSVYLKELTSALVDFPEVRVDIHTRARDRICVEAKDISPQIRVVQLKGGPERPVDRKNLYEFIPEFAENLIDYIHRKKEDYDVVHSHYWLSGLAGAFVKQELGLPLVHAYHTLGFLKKRALDHREHKNRIKSEQYLAHISDLIISPSAEEKNCLVGEYGISPEKVKVVYPGVNPRHFYPGRNASIRNGFKCHKDNTMLLYVGRIEPVKGLSIVIDALRLIKENNPSLSEKVKLYIIGGGEKEEELSTNEEVSRLERTIDRHGLKDKVIFSGSIDHLQLRKYYSAADALVVPSLYESFGLVTVEALACGTPLLVSQIGEMKSIVIEGKNGYFFRPNDPFSLWQSIEKMCNHGNGLWSRASIREDVIQKFSWDNTAGQTRKIFEELVQKPLRSKTIFRPDESLRPV